MRYLLILPLTSWMTFVKKIQTGRRKVEMPPPFLNSFLTVFFHRLYLAKSLQGTIMPFVKFPVFNNWDVLSIHLFGCIVEGLNGSAEEGGKTDIKLKPFLL